MTNLTQVQLIKTQTLARIVEITAEAKPTYMIDGQSVKWSEYLKQLLTTIEWCDSQLSAEEPFEIQVQAYT